MPEPIIIPVIYTEDTSGLENAVKHLDSASKATKDFKESQEKAFLSGAEDVRKMAYELQLAAQAQSIFTKIASLEAKLAISRKGSYNALNAELGLITLRLNQMSEKQIKNTKEGKALTVQLTKVKDEIKKLKDEQAPLNAALEGTQKNLGEMRKELLALKNTSFAGKTQAEIDGINQRIGTLTDSISDLQNIQNEFGNEFGSQIAGSLQVITAGVEGVVASLNILGIESESLKGLQKNVVDLIAVTQALGIIEDAIAKGTLRATGARIAATVATLRDTVVKQANTVSTLAAARAEDAKAVALARGNIITRGAAAVQWLWNAALAANPIGLVVVAVAALAAGVVYLTRTLGESAAATEQLNNQLGKTKELSEQNERLRTFEIALAQERGKISSEITALEIKQTNDRIAEKEKELALLRRVGDLTEEQAERYKALTFELIDLDKEKILLGERLKAQQADEANDRAKEAEKRAKEARAERERIRKDSEARAKERQDAELKELEAQKQLDLARLDAKKDYGETSIKYQKDFATLRFVTEQAAQKAILDKQKQFGRLTQTEYEAQLKQLEAAAVQFISELPKVLDPVGNALKRALEDAFNGDDGIKPLQNIFDANAEKDVKKRGEQIGKSAGTQTGETLARETRNAFERFFDGESLFDILGINPEIQDELKAQLQGTFANVLSGLGSLFDAEIIQQGKLVDARKTAVSELQSQLNEELKLKQHGFANDSDLLQGKLNEETALLAKEEEKRLALERKAAALRLKQEALQTASNIGLSVTKVIAAESGKGLLGVFTAIGAVASIFALIAKAKAQAAQFSTPPKLRHGGDLSDLFSGKVRGASHESGGVSAWLHTQGQYIELEGNEFVMPVSQTRQHHPFLEDMRSGEFDGKDIAKYYGTGEAFHEKPTDFWNEYGHGLKTPALPEFPDHVANMLPVIRKTATQAAEAAHAASRNSLQAVEIAGLRQDVAALTKIIAEKPDYIPITENGYIRKQVQGNTTSIAIYDPPKQKGKR